MKKVELYFAIVILLIAIMLSACDVNQPEELSAVNGLWSCNKIEMEVLTTGSPSHNYIMGIYGLIVNDIPYDTLNVVYKVENTNIHVMTEVMQDNSPIFKFDFTYNYKFTDLIGMQGQFQSLISKSTKIAGGRIEILYEFTPAEDIFFSRN